MVDRDRIKDKLGGDDSEQSGSSSGRSNPKRSSGSSDGGGSDGAVNIDKTSQEEKMEQFKKGEGVSSVDPDSAGDVSRREFEKMLRCVANMFMYVEGKHRAAGDPDGRTEENKFEVYDLFFKEYSDLISGHQVQYLCDKYGIDWEEDIISEELENGDYEERAGV